MLGRTATQRFFGIVKSRTSDRSAFFSTYRKPLSCSDVVIVGGGIVGVATARELKRQHPELSVTLVEKENALAQHQTGHNSGVIHAGIYYKPGSVKARLCNRGMDLLYKYLDRKNIPYKRVGKLIVATDCNELERLDSLFQRGMDNQVPDLSMIEGDKIKKYEPNARGLKAIYSPYTGIVDYGVVTNSFADDFKASRGEVILNFKVTDFQMEPKLTEQDPHPIRVISECGQFVKAAFVLCCAGLYADKLAVLTGGKSDPAIIPFRGEYLILKPTKENLVRGNIYPVPDPKFPFLGVHFTPRMDGSIWLGPNAILAYSREGYGYLSFSPTELLDSLSYRGLHKLIYSNFSYGIKETMKSLFKIIQVKELQRYVPSLSVYDVTSGPTGVRAQALSPNGELVEDFVFEGGDKQNPRILHCRNAPSPGATSSMAIAEVLVDKIRKCVANIKELEKKTEKCT
ncbi:L-2-hydroxyglutarate dehydrogenase, mitochondrial isoform X2 [Cimex lectularius]|uniref:L-2-hydroxyglutarate dehydrogenase, mitochondrial n=1 Tax=Cimex lectularius TaxID=79782 RepID=A0A8I6TI72_CIMLE|nr:L-2-hydroxyglutarate dehydrogenase, mitochondrial isoform X2 [Cimex lectularius]